MVFKMVECQAEILFYENKGVQKSSQNRNTKRCSPYSISLQDFFLRKLSQFLTM